MFTQRYLSGTLNRKRAMEEDEKVKCALCVKLISAIDIDRATMKPNSVDERIYKALVWVLPEKRYVSNVALGLPNPHWNRSCTFTLGVYRPDKYFLHVEIYRICSKSDPGTSTGFRLVGKTRIPVPKLDRKICDSYVLVRTEHDDENLDSNCVAEGQVCLSMETKRRLW